jgi:hypothetical protein
MRIYTKWAKFFANWLALGITLFNGCQAKQVTITKVQDVTKDLERRIPEGTSKATVEAVLTELTGACSWSKRDQAFYAILRNVEPDTKLGISGSVTIIVHIDSNSKCDFIKVEKVYTGP